MRKLVEGIFQEHFEFLHWVHDYVHRTYPDALKMYHGFERRQQVLGSELSLAQLNSANTNLVPKFSVSTSCALSAMCCGRWLTSDVFLVRTR